MRETNTSVILSDLNIKTFHQVTTVQTVKVTISFVCNSFANSCSLWTTFLVAESTEFAPPFKSNKTTLNCTVAFVLECISWSKCRTNCLSMGASSFRWFHNGCCECIGDTCINYGLSEAKYVLITFFHFQHKHQI